MNIPHTHADRRALAIRLDSAREYDPAVGIQTVEITEARLEQIGRALDAAREVILRAADDLGLDLRAMDLDGDGTVDAEVARILCDAAARAIRETDAHGYEVRPSLTGRELAILKGHAERRAAA